MSRVLPATSQATTTTTVAAEVVAANHSTRPSRTPTWVVVLVIALCINATILISQFFLLHQSLRLDEAQSLWQTSHTLAGTLKVVASDVHVPLYHVILHFWQVLFGNSVSSARLLSLTFFAITIPLFYVLARQVLSRGWALFAVVLFSLSPFMNWYGNEIRMYTLLALLSVINQIFFVRILKHRTGWLGYALSAVVGAYSHYFFMFNLIAQGIFYLIAHKQFARGSLVKFVATAALVLAALSPWLYYFRSLGSAANTSPLLPRPSTVDFFNAFSQFGFGFQSDQVNTVLVSCWPLIVLFAFFAIKRNQRIRPEIAYLFVAAFVPVLVAYVISLTIKPFFLSRYMIAMIAPLTIITVWFVSHYGRKWAVLVSTLLVLITLGGLALQITSASNPVKEDYRSVSQDITAQATTRDVVALSAPFTIYPFEYYYNGPATLTTLPIWDRVSRGSIPAFDAAKLPAQVEQLNQDHRYIYLVLSQDQGYETQIKQYYLDHFKQISYKQYSPKLVMYVFQIGYKDEPQL